MNMDRGSGILMPVFSLPSPYGIGTLGKAAHDFVDFLAVSGQKYWQMLPVGPTSYGDSPYQSFSSFAGNPYFVDLDLLAADGLLTAQELTSAVSAAPADRVDYSTLFNTRFALLRKAAERGVPRDRAKLDDFIAENSAWLPDYALFMALKGHFENRGWAQWPEEDIRLHRPEACKKYAELLKEDVDLYSYIQYLFYTQWDALKAYAAGKGISIIGDLPIYVAMDSADVWAEPHWFQLDEKNVPTSVAGVPPDYFSADGQLWGNPLYRWDEMEKDGFSWWIRRVSGFFRLFDVLRLDHFRGLASYWAVPYGSATAKNGRWVKGPGKALISAFHKAFPDKTIIVEDLGYQTEEVLDLLRFSAYPGMRLVEFGFEGNGGPYYRPYNYPVNCVCYVGTHDNRTACGWMASAEPRFAQMAQDYLGVREGEAASWPFIRAGMSSAAALFIMQMQDCLELGDEARINTPGIPSGNWSWRMKPGAANSALAAKLLRLTELYGRDPNAEGDVIWNNG